MSEKIVLKQPNREREHLQEAYLISTGDYDGYSVCSILLADEGKDIAQLYERFQQETGHPGLNDVQRWRERLSNEYQLTDYYTREDGSIYTQYAHPETLFSTWLVRTQGFVAVKWHDLNIGLYGDAYLRDTDSALESP